MTVYCRGIEGLRDKVDAHAEALEELLSDLVNNGYEPAAKLVGSAQDLLYEAMEEMKDDN